jgi:hypothetical protein
LRGTIRDVGFLRSVTVNRRTGFILDGHLRVALAIQDRQASIPVEYVDLDPAEEIEALATIDPVAALAEAEEMQLRSLLDEVRSGEAGVQQLLASLAEENGIIPPPESEPAYPRIGGDAHSFTVRYADADEPALRAFLGLADDELWDPSKLGRDVLRRIQGFAAPGPD